MFKAIKASTMQVYRIVTTTVILLILSVALIVSAVSSGESHRVSDSRAELIINLNRFMDGSAYLTSEVRAFAATGLTVHYDNYWNEVNTLKNRDIGVENMKTIGITDEENGVIEAMQTLSNELIPLESAAMDLVVAGDIDQAIESVFGQEYESTLNEIKALQVEISNLIDTRTAQSVLDVYSQNNVIYVVLFALIIILLTIQMLSEIVIRKKVITPIEKCSDALFSISKGNLRYELDVPSDDTEIGILAESTRETVDNLSKIVGDLSEALTHMSMGDFTYDVKASHLFVGDYTVLATAYQKITTDLPKTLRQLKEASDQVRVGSEHLADSAQSLAQGANEQTTSVKALHSNIEEISDKISQTANDSQNSKNASDKAYHALTETNSQMSDMIAAMEQISEKSFEIGKIIKTIDDIAFQTNILSLNAAVEAARAGAAGKGFAVVAEEVGNLATKSARSAKDTATLIEETLAAVERGNTVAKSTSGSIKVIFDAAGELSRCVVDIAGATEEQTQAAKHMSDEVELISSVVVSNSTAAEQTAAISEELFSQAHHLKDLVSRFKLDENDR